MHTNKLRKLRTDSGLNQSEWARMLGVSRSTVSRWEKSSNLYWYVEPIRMRRFSEIILVLRRKLTPEGVGQWFRWWNPDLFDHKPIDIAADGNLVAVYAAAHAFVRLPKDAVICAIPPIPL